VSTFPTYPPTAFEAGTTVAFTQGASFTGVGEVSPAGGWSLVWHLRKIDGGAEADVPATDDGERWTVTLSAATAATLSPGPYRWALRATQGPVLQTLSSGTITITPDLALGGEDVRTWEERTLEAVEAALSGTMEGGLKMYTIAGRQVSTMTPDELLKIRAQLQAAVSVARTNTFGRPVLQTVVWR
jgi:hypothetical protein